MASLDHPEGWKRCAREAVSECLAHIEHVSRALTLGSELQAQLFPQEDARPKVLEVGSSTQMGGEEVWVAVSVLCSLEQIS